MAETSVLSASVLYPYFFVLRDTFNNVPGHQQEINVLISLRKSHHWGVTLHMSTTTSSYMPEQINPLGSSSSCTYFLSPCKTSQNLPSCKQLGGDHQQGVARGRHHCLLQGYQKQENFLPDIAILVEFLMGLPSTCADTQIQVLRTNFCRTTSFWNRRQEDPSLTVSEEEKSIDATIITKFLVCSSF